MKKIGLIGESPNDTQAILNLLRKKYQDKVQFVILLKRITGHQLDAINKITRLLRAEWDKSLDFVIYIRDLDDLETNREKIQQREKWFHDLEKCTNGKGILLLNIYELEALILADINCFNKHYGTTLQIKGDPMRKKNPKEFLQEKTRKKKKYKESDCPDLFSSLNIKKLIFKCKYFGAFIVEFEKKL